MILTEQQAMIRESAARFAEQVIAPNSRAWEAAGEVDVWRSRHDRVAAGTATLRAIDRPYGLFDNRALAAALTPDDRHVAGLVGAIEPGRHRHDVTLTDGRTTAARIVVDWPERCA